MWNMLTEMPLEEFRARIEREQEMEYKTRLAMKEKRKEAAGKGGSGKLGNALINCKQCGRYRSLCVCLWLSSWDINSVPRGMPVMRSSP